LFRACNNSSTPDRSGNSALQIVKALAIVEIQLFSVSYPTCPGTAARCGFSTGHPTRPISFTRHVLTARKINFAGAVEKIENVVFNRKH
jgi:hypothetical protein